MFAQIRRMPNATKSAIPDNSFLSRVFSHDEAEEREGFLGELLRRYSIVVPVILIEEVVIGLARPKNPARAHVAQIVAEFLASHSASWIDDDVEIVFQELVLRQPIGRFPPLPKELIERIGNLSPKAPDLVAWVENLGKRKHDTVLKKRDFQNELVPEGRESCFDSPAAFMKASIYPSFQVILRDASARREMLETYFGIFFRRRHPDQCDKIDSAFESYRLDTLGRFPFTTAWLIAHFTYMRAPLVKIGAERQRRSLPCLIGRGKAQFNNDSDEKYVIAAMMCDRILTCDEGMRNVVEAVRASGYWSGQVVYFRPSEDLTAQISKLV
jgi:hypothetical protein